MVQFILVPMRVNIHCKKPAPESLLICICSFGRLRQVKAMLKKELGLMFGATDRSPLAFCARTVHLHPRRPPVRQSATSTLSPGPISHRKIARKRLGRESIRGGGADWGGVTGIGRKKDSDPGLHHLEPKRNRKSSAHQVFDPILTIRTWLHSGVI